MRPDQQQALISGVGNNETAGHLEGATQLIKAVVNALFADQRIGGLAREAGRRSIDNQKKGRLMNMPQTQLRKACKSGSPTL